MFKTGCATNLIIMLDRGDADEKCAAMGAISLLAQSEKHMTEVVNTKVSSQLRKGGIAARKFRA